MNHFDHVTFHRDSRHAFGYRFSVTKHSRDWVWTVAGLIVFVFAVLAFATKVS